MKINMKDGVGIEKNSESYKKIDMKINASMGMLLVTKYLYSNPIQTLVQEYLCNARDAMRMVNNTEDNIEVILPTKIDPLLRIRDYGPGISDELMDNVFRILGESNKRSSNELTGGFGIGAKSAFAYTDSFMIKSTIDGISKLYLAHMGEAQDGIIELIDKSETQEKNGIEIQINVKENDIPLFHKAVYRAIQFWDKKPEIKGLLAEEVKNNFTFPEPLVKINESTYIYKTDDVSKDLNAKVVFLIDKIPYILKKELAPDAHNLLLKTINYKCSLVIELQNGDVEVGANREEISQSDFSKSQSIKLLNNSINSIEEFVKEQISQIKSLDDLKKYVSIEDNILDKRRPVSLKLGDFSIEKDTIFYTIKKGSDAILFTHFHKDSKKIKAVITNYAPNPTLNHESVDFLEINEDISDLTLRKKIKQIILKNPKISHVYIIGNKTDANKESNEFLKTIYNFKKSSEIVLPKIQRLSSSEKESIRKEKTSVALKLSHNGFGVRSTQIELDSEQKYLLMVYNRESQYFPLMSKELDTSFYISKHAMEKFLKFFEAKGYLICRIQKPELEDYLSNPNCIALDDFLFNLSENLPLSKEELNSFAYYFWQKGVITKIFRELSKLENNPESLFNDILDYEKKIHDVYLKQLTSIPHDVLIYCLKKSPSIQELKEQNKVYYEKIESVFKKYPLIKHLNESISDYSCVIEYINLIKNRESNGN